MKYIGLSLGGCLGSLLKKEVSEDDVMFIVTRTRAREFTDYIAVVGMYHTQGNPYSRSPHNYILTNFSLEEVTELATRLWNNGLIHQPRLFIPDSIRGVYRHPVGYGDGLWMEIVPTNQNSTPAVIEAYNQYKMLDSLTRD